MLHIFLNLQYYTQNIHKSLFLPVKVYFSCLNIFLKFVEHKRKLTRYIVGTLYYTFRCGQVSQTGKQVCRTQ